MVDFLYMIDHKSVAEDKIPEEYRGPFGRLKTDVTGVLGPLSCPMHTREIRVVLNGTGGEVQLSGLGPCCEEFGNVMRDAIDRSHLRVPDAVWLTGKRTFTGPPQQ